MRLKPTYSEFVRSAFFSPMRCFLIILSALLFYLCYPGYDQGWIAWFAISPLIISCYGLTIPKAFLVGAIWGNITHVLILKWLFDLPGFGILQAIPLSLYMGLYSAMWCAGLAGWRNGKWSLFLGGSMLWIILEYIKHHAGFMALPWTTLAHTQYKNIALLQTGSITGEYGIAFLVVLANIALADLVLRRSWLRFSFVIALVALFHGAGAFYLYQQKSSDTVKMALVQPCIFRSERKSQEKMQKTVDRLIYYSERVASSHPAVIVWPETSVKDPLNNKPIHDRIVDLVSRIRIPLIVGASEFVKFPTKPDSSTDSPASFTINKKFYNSAFFYKPDQPLDEPYRKMVLVPFAEYLPLEERFTWPKWLIPGHFGVTAGESTKQFVIEENTFICPIICWENLFADFVRRVVRNGCDVVIQLTNDNWFGMTVAAQQHNVASVFRAVENCRPVMVVSNNGPSIIVDHHGRIVAAIEGLFVEGTLVYDVEINHKKTFYTKYGDIFVLINIVLFFILLPFQLSRRKINKE